MEPSSRFRSLSGLVAIAFTVSVFGCGKPAETSPSNPAGTPYGSVPPPRQNTPGMSTGKKVALLAGAAALVYLYNKHKNARGAGAQGQYYLSKNGRVYYRDSKGNAVWVTPPKEGIPVPQEQAAVYERAAQSGNWNIGQSSPARPLSRPSFSTPSAPPGPPGPRR